MNRSDLLLAFAHPNVGAFLAVLREGETNQTDDAYRMQFGGGLFDVQAGWKHPHQAVTSGGVTSTAAGAYQFLAKTWDALVEQYGFEDFSPANQHLGAIALIAGRKALDDVMAGRLDAAIRKLTAEWTSLALPKRQAQAPQVFTGYGGTLATPPVSRPFPVPIAAPPPEVMPMGIFAALLPTIIQLIPQLASVFKPGSEVAQRNVAAATIVTQAISDATQAVNLQDAVEKMQSDPAALAAAQKAVNDVWPSLIDSGPAVTEARKAASSNDQTPPWKNPAVWITFLFVPLIYGAAWAVLYREGASDDLKTMVVTAIFAGLLGSITGFFLGSSLGSQRKDALIGK